ncbi:hypothetical protein DYB35_002800 [Aphanomyces astaci]|uniref:Uncharacterized protein n=1 Tax=Aphanomyces astaci TaxID=112090 RepID=A0A3R7B4W3_APHAT|nr:hypothetical protein DYB35_002800 [Aphanomyces astaci]
MKEGGAKEVVELQKEKKAKKAKKSKKKHRREEKDEFGRDILPGSTQPTPRSPRSRSRSRGRRLDVTKKSWTHDAYFNRSPSPIRQVDPFYKPNPESWVSRAGGVYLPKK